MRAPPQAIFVISIGEAVGSWDRPVLGRVAACGRKKFLGGDLLQLILVCWARWGFGCFDASMS